MTLISTLKKYVGYIPFVKKAYWSLLPYISKARFEAFYPVERLTCKRKFHWGSYYDVQSFDPTNRYVVANEVEFEDRSPTPDDIINIALIDTWNNNKWIPLGASNAWNWQQGCMLQWAPGNVSEVVWNDRQDDHFISYVYNLETQNKRTLPHPVYGIAKDAEFTIFPDFARLNDTRPGYGYAGVPDKNFDQLAPESSGIWKMDMKTGECKMLFSLYDIVNQTKNPHFSANAKHWFNCTVINPDATRFAFLHRWRGDEEGEYWKTNFYTANTSDGKDLVLVNGYDMFSHFYWRDNNTIIAYARRPDTGDCVYLFDANSGYAQPIEDDVFKNCDTHISFVPGTNAEWVLNDSYPKGNRMQELYLYHLPTHRKVMLGYFYSPINYQGEWRCDIHPRCSRDGKKVVFDSTHEGYGRQIYMIDISSII